LANENAIKDERVVVRGSSDLWAWLSSQMKENSGLDDGKHLTTLEWRVASDDKLESLTFEKGVNQGRAQGVWPSGLH
jgi:urease accessory protein UreF